MEFAIYGTSLAVENFCATFCLRWARAECVEEHQAHQMRVHTAVVSRANQWGKSLRMQWQSAALLFLTDSSKRNSKQSSEMTWCHVEEKKNEVPKWASCQASIRDEKGGPQYKRIVGMSQKSLNPLLHIAVIVVLIVSELSAWKKVFNW